MSRKVLAFGYDACHRWAVLRLAGYTVHVCESISQLRERLMKRHHIDAVLMVEDIVSVPTEAITAARSYFLGPLVLFEARPPTNYRDSFDLCVPILTGPSLWLQDLDALISTRHAGPESPHAEKSARQPHSPAGSTRNRVLSR